MIPSILQILQNTERKSPNVEVAYFEEKSLNWKFHRNIYYFITLSKFFPLHFQQLKQIDRISWPSNSPDLNPIENLWTLLKDKVGQLKPSNLDQLEKNIKTVWSNFLQNLAETLTLSMSERMKQLIERKGDTIDY